MGAGCRRQPELSGARAETTVLLQTEMGLKLWAPAPKQEVSPQESMQRSHSGCSRPALGRWKGRQGLPILRKKKTSAMFGYGQLLFTGVSLP